MSLCWSPYIERHACSSDYKIGMSIHICNIGMCWDHDEDHDDVKVDPMACVFLDHF